MSFEALLDDEGGSFSKEDVEKLRYVIKEYEVENRRLKDEWLAYKESAENVREWKNFREKERNTFMKQINTLRQNVNIEKKATDGLAKKNGALEAELTIHKEERKTLTTEMALLKHKVQDYERKLNDDRAKRLQNMHENEILRRANAQLTAQSESAGEGERKAAASLLEKVQLLDTATTRLDQQKRVISAQGDEMLDLNREITALKETMKNISENMLRTQTQMVSMNKERDEFEQESFRLRKELVKVAASNSDKSAAFASFASSSALNRSRPHTTASKYSTNGAVSRASTANAGFSRGGGSRGGGGTTPSSPIGSASMSSFSFLDWEETDHYKRGVSSQNSQRGRSPMRATSSIGGSCGGSPNSSIMGNSVANDGFGYNTEGRTRSPPTPMHNVMRGGSISALSTSIHSGDSMPAILSPISSNNKKQSPEKGKKKKNRRSVANAPLTRYVGQGLGLKSDPPPKYSKGGSAKQVLARILAESDE